MSATRTYTFFACIFFIAISGVSNAQDKPPPPSTYTPALPSADYPYPNGGAKLGQGWDSFNQRATAGSCVEFAETRLEKSSFETHVEQIQSSYSLITKTTTSVSASYSGFGAGGSGSVSSSSSLNINTDDQNFLFTFESSDGSTFAVAPDKGESGGLELSDQAVKGLTAVKSDAAQQTYLAKLLGRSPLSVGGMTTLTAAAKQMRKTSKFDFDRICGDGFVSAIHRGGRINFLLTQKFASTETANSLSASLSASGYGASGSASYSTSTTRLNKTDNLSYRVFQYGGVPFKPAALPATIAAGQFFDVNTILPPPDQLIANPTAFTVTVTPYENVVTDIPKGEKFPSPLRLLTVGDYYVALRDEYHLVEGILNIFRSGTRSDANFPFDPKLINIFGGEKGLESLYDSIHFDLVFLEDVISQCYSKQKACTVKEAVEAAVPKYQARLQDLIQLKPKVEARIAADNAAKAEKAAKAAEDKKNATAAAAAKAADAAKTAKPADAPKAADLAKSAATLAADAVKAADDAKAAAAKAAKEASDLLAPLKLDADSLKIFGAEGTDERQWSLPQINEAIARLTELTNVAKNGQLDLAFFLRFYQYLCLTPLPKVAYSGTDFVALQKLEFLAVANKDQAAQNLQKQLDASNEALKRASFSFRLTPWKKFFCETLESSPLCVPEGTLRSIQKATEPAIEGDQLTPITPPPATPIHEKLPWPWRGPCPGMIGNFDCL